MRASDVADSEDMNQRQEVSETVIEGEETRHR